MGTTGAEESLPLEIACDFGVLLATLIEELDKCRAQNRPPTACLLARLHLQLARARMLVFPSSVLSANEQPLSQPKISPPPNSPHIVEVGR